MSQMSFSLKKITAWAIPLVMVLATLVAASPAQANGTLRSIRLLQPSLNSSNSWDSTSAWSTGAYYSAQTKSYVSYQVPGASLTLTYEAKDSAGVALANTAIRLRVNSNYSNSGATWTSGATSIPACSGGSCETQLTGTTNSVGQVTFTLTNTNNSSPVSTQTALNAAPDSVNTELFSTMLPTFVGGVDQGWNNGNASDQAVDIVNFRLVENLPTAAASQVDSIRLLQTSVAGTSAWDSTSTWSTGAYYSAQTKSYVSYQVPGSKLSLTYVAKNASGVAMASTAVNLRVNANYSGSAATWTSGATSIPAGCDGSCETVISGTTNAAGQVTFTLTNADTTSVAATPSALNARPASDTALHGTVQPTFVGGVDQGWNNGNGATQAIDIVAFFIVNNLPGTATAPSSPSGQTYNIRLDAASKALYTGGSPYDASSWYRIANTTQYARYLDKGATQTINYVVTNGSNAAVPGATVDLAVSVPDNNVTWSSGGVAYTTQTLSAVTNSSGVATFTVTNTNTAYENRRVDLSTWSSPAGSEYRWDFKPSIQGAGQSDVQNVDWIWGHVINDIFPANAPAAATIVLKTATKSSSFLTPALWGSSEGHCCGMSPNDTTYLKFLKYGETLNLEYRVTTNGTTPMAQQSVTVAIVGAATWNVDGVAKAAGDTLTGTTDANGDVSFALTNTNTVAQSEAGRASLNTWTDNTKGNADLVGDFRASVGATAETRDLLWVHVFEGQVKEARVSKPLNPNNKGSYMHVRLDPEFLQNTFDASWWDGIWQYRDPDTQAYLKYIASGSTFKLNYQVTDAIDMPVAGIPVTLIVNANYSCSKTTFMYQNQLIKPDNCAGGGETRLPAKLTDAHGRVSFTLTNMNENGEAMPADLSMPPTVGIANEVNSTFRVNVAEKEGYDMLLAHFVKATDSTSATVVSAPKTANIADARQKVLFQLKDGSGKALQNVDVRFLTNGVGTVGESGTTDEKGYVTAYLANSSNAGEQTVALQYSQSGKLPVTSSAIVTWVSTAATVSIAGGTSAVSVKIANSAGSTVKIVIAGVGTFTRKVGSANATLTFKTSAGSKKVTVTINGKSTSRVVVVNK
jgi:hypothetical protein